MKLTKEHEIGESVILLCELFLMMTTTQGFQISAELFEHRLMPHFLLASPLVSVNLSRFWIWIKYSLLILNLLRNLLSRNCDFLNEGDWSATYKTEPEQYQTLIPYDILISFVCVLTPQKRSEITLTRDTHLMQQFIYYYKQLYMFRASICPSSGVLGCIRIILLHMVSSTRCCGWGSEAPVCSLVYWCKFCIRLASRIHNLHQWRRLHTDSSQPQPQHLVLDTIWSSIIRIQPNTPEDGHIDARNM